MKIRRLTMNDYDEMVKLWSRTNLPFKPKGRDSKEAIAVQMKVNREIFLGAFVRNRLVGTVIIGCDMRKGWINRLAVDPDYRKRGIAKALITESEKTLRKRDIRIFCALIEDYNAASKRLFKECGYVEHRDIIYFSKRDSDEV
ncbi:MAG: GNAT family N-acetyltransferase [Candidatus Bathyarchaeota archaeon]|nr:GNAT family N-acetyltransferase [Candidatus Bathyarchaeota archaeon]MDH5712436.1 GNAT family N-acetyltransferase [Candidatus Bathyarchaeota archaeon]